MNEINRHIEFLLIRHDCVIVPGFGAFIAHYRPASFGSGGRILPPHRSVGFNPDITHDDGLLVASVARRRAISYEAAKAIVAQEVGVLRYQIEHAGEISIDRVGRISRISSDGNNLWRFTPDSDSISVASLSYKAFPVLEAVPLAEAVSMPDGHVEDQPSIALPKPKPRRSDMFYIPVPKVLVKAAAVIAVVVGLGLAIVSSGFLGTERTDNVYQASIVQNLDKGNAPKASTPSVSVNAEVKPLAAPVLVDSISNSVVMDPAAVSKADVPSEKKTTAEASVSDNKASGRGTFCVVVASLPSQRRADKFIAANSGDDLWVLNQDGRFRVVITTASTEDEAKAIALDPSMQKRFPGAWVTQK